MSAELYPIMLTPNFLVAYPVLVVGGGTVAERKIKHLLEVGSEVRVIAPTLTPTLQELARVGRFEWCARTWQDDDIQNFAQALLVFAATDSPTINQQVSRASRAAHKLLNRADDPYDCDFVLPGVVRSGEITLTVSTSALGTNEERETSGETGVSPALTALLRQKLVEAIGPEYSKLALLLRELRPHVKNNIPAPKRASLWRQMVNSTALDLLRNDDKKAAQSLLHNLVEQAKS